MENIFPRQQFMADPNQELDLQDLVTDVNQMITKNMPELIDPMDYWSFNGFIALFAAPFVQGLFQGLGEGVAKVIVGRWVGMDAYTALGARVSITKHL
jgi:hypothetical protein